MFYPALETINTSDVFYGISPKKEIPAILESIEQAIHGTLYKKLDLDEMKDQANQSFDKITDKSVLLLSSPSKPDALNACLVIRQEIDQLIKFTETLSNEIQQKINREHQRLVGSSATQTGLQDYLKQLQKEEGVFSKEIERVKLSISSIELTTKELGGYLTITRDLKLSLNILLADYQFLSNDVQVIEILIDNALLTNDIISNFIKSLRSCAQSFAVLSTQFSFVSKYNQQINGIISTTLQQIIGENYYLIFTQLEDLLMRPLLNFSLTLPLSYHRNKCSDLRSKITVYVEPFFELIKKIEFTLQMSLEESLGGIKFLTVALELAKHTKLQDSYEAISKCAEIAQRVEKYFKELKEKGDQLKNETYNLLPSTMDSDSFWGQLLGHHKPFFFTANNYWEMHQMMYLDFNDRISDLCSNNLEHELEDRIKSLEVNWLILCENYRKALIATQFSHEKIDTFLRSL